VVALFAPLLTEFGHAVALLAGRLGNNLVIFAATIKI
jgi:hypothetical protein